MQIARMPKAFPTQNSERHVFAHKESGIVRIPVFGAVTLGQLVLEGGAARFGLTCSGASHWQVIGITHGRKVNDVHNRKTLGIKDAFPAEILPKPHIAVTRHKIRRI
jgi:hypothetical protein